MKYFLVSIIYAVAVVLAVLLTSANDTTDKK